MARRFLRSALGQTSVLLLLTLVLGAGVNAARPNRIPWDSRPAYPILPHIDLGQTIQALEAGDCLFLDARPVEFFRRAHILNAVSVPLTSTDAEVRKILPMPHPYRQVIVYCEDESCDAADAMARRLKRMGYEKLVVLEGGWRVWSQAGLPTG